MTHAKARVEALPKSHEDIRSLYAIVQTYDTVSSPNRRVAHIFETKKFSLNRERITILLTTASSNGTRSLADMPQRRPIALVFIEPVRDFEQSPLLLA